MFFALTIRCDAFDQLEKRKKAKAKAEAELAEAKKTGEI